MLETIDFTWISDLMELLKKPWKRKPVKNHRDRLKNSKDAMQKAVDAERAYNDSRRRWKEERKLEDYRTYSDMTDEEQKYNGRTYLGDSLEIVRKDGILIDTFQTTKKGIHKRLE